MEVQQAEGIDECFRDPGQRVVISKVAEMTSKRRHKLFYGAEKAVPDAF